MKRRSGLIGRGALVALFSFALLSVFPEASRGHAFPDHSDPKVGATILKSPALIRIWFDSALEPAFSTIIVQDSGGRLMGKGKGQVNSSDPTVLETSVPQLPAGTYRVIWDVVARDGHRTTGDYTFVIK